MERQNLPGAPQRRPRSGVPTEARLSAQASARTQAPTAGPDISHPPAPTPDRPPGRTSRLPATSQGRRCVSGQPAPIARPTTASPYARPTRQPYARPALSPIASPAGNLAVSPTVRRPISPNVSPNSKPDGQRGQGAPRIRADGRHAPSAREAGGLTPRYHAVTQGYTANVTVRNVLMGHSSRIAGRQASKIASVVSVASQARTRAWPAIGHSSYRWMSVRAPTPVTDPWPAVRS